MTACHLLPKFSNESLQSEELMGALEDQELFTVVPKVKMLFGLTREKYVSVTSFLETKVHLHWLA